MPPADTPPGTARLKATATRTNTRSTAQANFKDPLATLTTIVTDHDTGLRYLHKKEFLPAGTETTTERLATALFQIAQLPNVPATAIDGIRAVAFLLEKAGTTALVTEIHNTLRTSLSETITNHVIASISPHVASIQDAALALKSPPLLAAPTLDKPTADNPVNPLTPSNAPNPVVTHPGEDALPYIRSIQSTVNALQDKMPLLEAIHKHLVITGSGDVMASISTTLDRTEMLVDDVSLGLLQATDAVNSLLPALDSTQAQMAHLVGQMVTPIPPQLPQPNATPARSYSDVAKTPPTPQLASAALAKAETRSRQVLFTPAPGQTLYSKTTDPGSIAIDILDATIPFMCGEAPHVDIKAVVCLNNGNLLVELSTAEAADWLRSEETRKILSNSLGIDAVVKERTLTLPKTPSRPTLQGPGPKAHQTTLDDYARKPPNKPTVAITISSPPSSSLPPHVLDYPPSSSHSAFDDPTPSATHPTSAPLASHSQHGPTPHDGRH
ncbi:hypothetical protein EDD15DRAFT_2192467 [Pisolithus albus]|nr:hypothetical protein EDD15DRAFT_2192467 [Pisolithus albus]